MTKVLTKRDFLDKDTPNLARNLLGKFLVRRDKKKEIVLMITEVEAYDGFYDLASHASRGKTPRNAPMFGDAGVWYLYFVYGMHHMLNIVTGPKGYPAAILIRGVEGIAGPGRVTKILGITKKRFNEQKIDPEGGLFILDKGVKVLSAEIHTSPRIGVSYAGPVWSKKPYRFLYTY